MEDMILMQLECDLEHAKEDLAMFDKESEKACYVAFSRIVTELEKMVEFQRDVVNSHRTSLR